MPKVGNFGQRVLSIPCLASLVTTVWIDVTYTASNKYRARNLVQFQLARPISVGHNFLVYCSIQSTVVTVGGWVGRAAGFTIVNTLFLSLTETCWFFQSGRVNNCRLTPNKTPKTVLVDRHHYGEWQVYGSTSVSRNATEAAKNDYCPLNSRDKYHRLTGAWWSYSTANYFVDAHTLQYLHLYKTVTHVIYHAVVLFLKVYVSYAQGPFTWWRAVGGKPKSIDMPPWYYILR